MSYDGELMLEKMGFIQLRSQTTILYSELEEAHDLTVKLQKSISESDWEGKNKKEFVAFLSLIEQFHKKLFSESLINQKNDLAEMCKKLDAFYEEFTQYQRIL